MHGYLFCSDRTCHYAIHEALRNHLQYNKTVSCERVRRIKNLQTCVAATRVPCSTTKPQQCIT